MKSSSRKSISENVKTASNKEISAIKTIARKNQKRKTKLLKSKKTCSCVKHKIWSTYKHMLQFVRQTKNLASISGKMYSKNITTRMENDNFLTGRILCNPCFVYYKTNHFGKKKRYYVVHLVWSECLL